RKSHGNVLTNTKIGLTHTVLMRLPLDYPRRMSWPSPQLSQDGEMAALQKKATVSSTLRQFGSQEQSYRTPYTPTNYHGCKQERLSLADRIRENTPLWRPTAVPRTHSSRSLQH